MNDCILKVYYDDKYAGRSVGGQCFVIGSYLITAAHVIDELIEPYVLIDGQNVQLRKENSLHYVRKISKSDNIIEDCAIFALSKEYKTLHLKSAITVGDKLKCFYNTHVESRILNVSNAKVVNKAKHFFLSNVSPMLYKACSGCPIIANGNQVVGMLVGGDDKSICVFQSAAFIENIINNYLEQHII